jgi:hypothetical protein
MGQQSPITTPVPLLQDIALPDGLSVGVVRLVIKSRGALIIKINAPPVEVEVWGIAEDGPGSFSGFTSSVGRCAHEVRITVQDAAGTMKIFPLEDGGL